MWFWTNELHFGSKIGGHNVCFPCVDRGGEQRRSQLGKCSGSSTELQGAERLLLLWQHIYKCTAMAKEGVVLMQQRLGLSCLLSHCALQGYSRIPTVGLPCPWWLNLQPTIFLLVFSLQLLVPCPGSPRCGSDSFVSLCVSHKPLCGLYHWPESK